MPPNGSAWLLGRPTLRRSWVFSMRPAAVGFISVCDQLKIVTTLMPTDRRRWNSMRALRRSGCGGLRQMRLAPRRGEAPSAGESLRSPPSALACCVGPPDMAIDDAQRRWFGVPRTSAGGPEWPGNLSVDAQANKILFLPSQQNVRRLPCRN